MAKQAVVYLIVSVRQKESVLAAKHLFWQLSHKKTDILVRKGCGQAMTTKIGVRTKKANRGISISTANPFVESIVWAMAGFAAAFGQLLNGMFPFGVALAMGLNAPYALFAAAGAAAGYAIALPTTEGARYLGALASVAAVRILLKGRPENKSGVLPACIAGGGTLILIQAMLTVGKVSQPAQMLFTASEAILCCTLAVAVWAMWAFPGGTAGKELGGLVTFGAMTAALTAFRVLGFQAAWIVPPVFLLAEGWRGRRTRMLPAAIAAAVAVAAGTPENAFAGAFLALGALAASFFPGEKGGMALVYFTAGCLGGAAAPNVFAAVDMIASSGAASLAFLCIPRQWMASAPTPPKANSVDFQAAVRLSALASALEAVGETVQQVVSRLPSPGEGYNWVTDQAAEQVCKKCGRQAECWGEHFSETVEGLWKLKPCLEESGNISLEQLPHELCRCQKPAALCDSLSRSYALLQGRRAAAAHSKAMRAALCEQFGAVAGALAEIGSELGAGEAEDHQAQKRTTELLWSLGLSPVRVAVLSDRMGRVRASILIRRTALSVEEQEQLAQEIGQCCKTLLELPRLTTEGAFTQLDFGEKAMYSPICAECSLSAQAGKFCGDHAEHFCDTQGNLHLILCDGMGTGKPAALDGALAASLTAKLVQAGFGGEQAARLVNVALELKSDEDSAAALDVASIDLYTGQLKLFKAGAATSFLVRKGKIRRLQGSSLPVGILGGVVGGCHNIALYENDVLVLCSDGALNAGEDWMEAQLAAFWQMPPNELAAKLAKQAAVCAAGHPDDVTVQIMRMEKARV